MTRWFWSVFACAALLVCLGTFGALLFAAAVAWGVAAPVVLVVVLLGSVGLIAFTLERFMDDEG